MPEKRRYYDGIENCAMKYLKLVVTLIKRLLKRLGTISIYFQVKEYIALGQQKRKRHQPQSAHDRVARDIYPSRYE